MTTNTTDRTDLNLKQGKLAQRRRGRGEDFFFLFFTPRSLRLRASLRFLLSSVPSAKSVVKIRASCGPYASMAPMKRRILPGTLTKAGQRDGPLPHEEAISRRYWMRTFRKVEVSLPLTTMGVLDPIVP
jgi:hypothetical protein